MKKCLLTVFAFLLTHASSVCGTEEPSALSDITSELIEGKLPIVSENSLPDVQKCIEILENWKSTTRYSQEPFSVFMSDMHATVLYLREKEKPIDSSEKEERKKAILADTSTEKERTRYFQILFLAEKKPEIEFGEILRLPNLKEELTEIIEDLEHDTREVEMRAKFDQLKKREDIFYKNDGIHLDNIAVEPIMAILIKMGGVPPLDLTDFNKAAGEFNIFDFTAMTGEISLSQYQEMLKKTGLVQKLKKTFDLVLADHKNEAELSLDKILSCVESVGFLESFFQKVSVILPWVESQGEDALRIWLMGSLVESANAYPDLEGSGRVGCPKGICEGLVLGLSGLRSPLISEILSIGQRRTFFTEYVSSSRPAFVRNFLESVYKNTPEGRKHAEEEWISICGNGLDKLCSGAVETINGELERYDLPLIADSGMYFSVWKVFMRERIAINAFYVNWKEILAKPRIFRSGFGTIGNLVIEPL